MPFPGRKPRSQKRVLALPDDGLEDELLGLLVEEENRRCLRVEDRPCHLDDRRKKRSVRLVGSNDAGGDGGLQVRVLGHLHPHVGRGQIEDALQLERCQVRMLGEDQGADRAEMQRSEAVPDTLSERPPTQGTSTLTPRPKNSTGGFGL